MVSMHLVRISAYEILFWILPVTPIMLRLFRENPQMSKNSLTSCGMHVLWQAALYLLVRPKTIVFGRTYVLRMMFFSEHEISEMRGPTGLKFCTMVSTRPNFIMPVQNFGGAHPQKISGAKNMQNLARFRTTSKFGGEYLRNG